ncbi:YceI family protein [Antarcticibacterium flavum]|uniref:YceI family protein n=1 Tax=Antarcticibacterium flavum TaxID=2058175 RepID=A0A5B7WZ35_9FLAO|nr:YceI family protein [Antarcticibacterium flavum]QCY68436.1 YceI family protein [Antarcticibacterium flavum]
MKKLGLYIFLLLLSTKAGLAQEIFQTNNARITFFSSAPIEDIKAVSKEGISVYDPGTGEIIFKVRMRSFEFAKELMREHFNENYIESHKYPVAIFRGIISPVPGIDSPGDYQVIFKGELDIHGRSRPREIPGNIIIQDDQLQLRTEFFVANKDHEIKIPG